MSDAMGLPTLEQEAPRPVRSGQRFPASLGRFDDPAACRTMDALAKWVEDYFRAELEQRSSKHAYISTLPPDTIEQFDELRDSPVIRDAILRHFEPGSVLTPMKHTDELYISHYNKDYGGDQGLFSKHYDGNLRFLPIGSVVRALIYLQSDATYKVVFGDSQVEKAFTSYEFGLLDFHRELHWVEGEYNPSDVQRILIKCNYFIAPQGAGLPARVVRSANTGVFYVVKAAMEYSKSPKNPAQFAVGLLCNVLRLLNNIHPLVPLMLIALVFSAAVWGIVQLFR